MSTPRTCSSDRTVCIHSNDKERRGSSWAAVLAPGLPREQSEPAAALHRRTAPHGRVPTLGWGSVSDEEAQGARLDLDLPLPRQPQGLETQRGGNQGVGSHQTPNLLAP